ncbi:MULTISPECIES: hypothetical protein [unclassified Streptomyces]|uniref:hypothetical protein n=1 Tax=unclassified Streptomyces TaxID=2593676 RepID=UPI001654C403|nr:hypothetical protein [Streptomyces sp. CB02980]MCB8905574.1 hypothetical protein [Streptomyces sp. CB02980]
MFRTTPRTRRALLTAAAALLLSGCTAVGPGAPTTPGVPSGKAAQDALLKAAEHRLVVDCLSRRGLSPASRPRAPDEERKLQTALFGAGPRELSVTLATGATVTAHEDGCVAGARQRLYGDQRRWFRAQVVVDNLRAEAQARMRDDPTHRAALDRWTRCVAPPGSPRPDRPDPAVAARCSRESGLDEVRERLEAAELATVRALRRDELTTYRQLRDRALRQAVELPAPIRPQKGTILS